MTNTPKKQPNPNDVLVGQRIKHRRIQLGLSQGKLGDAVGVTFQQIQKYEKGTNRVGSSRMIEIATALKTTPAAFFEGCESAEVEPQIVLSPKAFKLGLAFDAINNPALQSAIIAMVKASSNGSSTQKSADIVPLKAASA